MSNQNQAIEYYNRGCELLKQECNQEALKEFEKAIECDPCLTSALINAGVCWQNEYKHDKAGYYYLKAIESDNDSRIAHFNYGWSLACMDRHKEAICEFEIALRMAPKNAETHWQLAYSYAFTKRPFKSMMYATKAIILSPFALKGYKSLREIATVLFCEGVLKVLKR